VPFGAVRRGRNRVFAVIDEGVAYLGGDLPSSIDEALSLPAHELRRRLSTADLAGLTPVDLADAPPAAPVGDAQEIWASGVTYERSRAARVAESTQASVYDMVYEAERPELFLKATASRVVGPGELVGIRADSTWDVPEPELVLVVNADGEIVGYTLGNDMSSRSIEGENPLYLPQAKIYERACAIGPVIVPAWDLPRVTELEIEMRVDRGGEEVFVGRIGVGSIRRPLQDLVDHLFRSLTFPFGTLLFTGTGIVPAEGFTLEAGDEVAISADPIGTLRNPVVVV
jgi:2-dehydro-3-deoxy-D-arabinonate dehydratase